MGGALPLKDCFPQLEGALSQYEALVAGVREVRPGHTNPRDMEQLRQKRSGIKRRFIALDHATRDAMEGVPARKQQRAMEQLKDLRRQLRLLDDEFKALVEQISGDSADADREELLAGGTIREGAPVDPKRDGNDTLLAAAKRGARTTTQTLQDGLASLRQAEETGRAAAETLVQDNDRLHRANEHVDVVQSEAHLANKIITRFAKRMYTDKLLKLFACVVAVVVVGIIVLAVL